MNPWRALILAALSILVAAPAPRDGGAARSPEAVLGQIADWELRRSLGAGKLTELALGADSAPVRTRAFLALARIQDFRTAETVVAGLRDRDGEVRAMAAFAAGQLALSWGPFPDEAKGMLARAVLGAEAKEESGPARLALLETLGKLGTPEAVTRLLVVARGQEVQPRAQALLSIGIAYKRKSPAVEQGFATLLESIQPEQPEEVRFGAGYALAYSGASRARPGLTKCANDTLPELRALCAKGLGSIGDGRDVSVLKGLVTDSDYRVAVEAVRALAKLAKGCKGASCPPLAALSGVEALADRLVKGEVARGGQPILALAQEGLPPAGKPLLLSLQRKIRAQEGKVGKLLAEDLVNLDCRLAAALDGAAGTVSSVLDCGTKAFSEDRRLVWSLRAIAAVPVKNEKEGAKRAAAVSSYSAHNSPSVRIAAVEALETAGGAGRARVRTLLTDEDPYVSAYAAKAAATLKDKESAELVVRLGGMVSQTPDIAEPVADAIADLGGPGAEEELRRWLSASHAHVRDSAARALARLRGKPVFPERAERPQPREPPPPISQARTMTLKLAKGEVVIRLLTEEAPFTAATIVKLAERGFYRRLDFHRVVPNFVVQGGDPHGDGEGGPGFTIPCEVSPRHYRRGAVGMSLSGKDTGGSQFFITTAPTPHLDGRYTIFGEVISGDEFVDQILEGERILEFR